MSDSSHMGYSEWEAEQAYLQGLSDEAEAMAEQQAALDDYCYEHGHDYVRVGSVDRCIVCGVNRQIHDDFPF